MREDDGGQFHAHADIHAVRFRADVQLAAYRFHPLAAAAANGYDALLAVVFAFFADDAIAALDHADAGNGRVKVEIHLVAQKIVEVLQDDVVDIRAEMAHGRVQQVQLVLDADLFELRARGAVQLRARAAVFEVDLVHVMHQVERLLFADVFVQRAAERVGDIIFAIGKRARAAETAHNRAALAFDAGLDLVPVDGAVPLFKRMTGFKDGDFQPFAALDQFIGGVNSSGARAHNDDVIFHPNESLSVQIALSIVS